MAYLERCMESAHYAADRLGWDVISCCDGNTAYPVEQCCYGHLHGYAIRRRLEEERNGTTFSLISADYLGFVPKKICE